MKTIKIIKIFSGIFLLFLVFSLAFVLGIVNNSKKIFTSGENQSSIIKQFSDLVINPSKSLSGEEKGQVNILILGSGGEGHTAGSLTDTIIILSVKPETHEAGMLSIPRDLYVELEDYNIAGKINSVKQQADNSPQENGNEVLKEVIKDISGMEINYVVEIDFKGFIESVDALGGIDFYLENDINDPTYPNFSKGYDPFYLEKGWHHLDGDTALKVARSRHSTMGDFDRIKRQQEIIKAFKQKIYEKYDKFDIIAFNKMMNSLSGNLKTDLELKEIPRLYQIMKETRNNDFSMQTIDTTNYLERVHIGLGYTLALPEENYEETQKMKEEIFNKDISEELKETLKEENAFIEIKNATDSPDIANTISKELEDLGFRVIKSSNVSLDISGVTIQYKKDNQKENTLNFLTESFGGKTEIIEEIQNEADFVLILGKGF